MLPLVRRMPLKRRKRTVLPAPGVGRPGHRPGTLTTDVHRSGRQRGTNNPVTLYSGQRGWESFHFRTEAIHGFEACTSLTEERLMSDTNGHGHFDESDHSGSDAARDIADVPAVEIINTVAVHLMSAAAVKCGLADDPENQQDLDQARKLITALAGLVTAGAPEIGDVHARPLRDGLRSVQLAFREASAIPDAPGKGPGEKWTGPVS